MSAIVVDVAQDLVHELETLERDAIGYAKRYAEWIVLKDSPTPPHQPAGLHAMGAKMIRELVLDRAALP